MASTSQVSSLEDRVLCDTMNTPILALIRLTLEIDRQLRLLLAPSGQLGRYKSTNPPQAIALLNQRGVSENLPPHLTKSIEGFWRLRNQIVHMNSGGEALAARVVDTGLRVLRMLMDIPRPRFVIKHANIPLYSDQELQKQLSELRGILVQSYDWDGKDAGLHFHPSTQTYSRGMNISLEWKATSPEGRPLGLNWSHTSRDGWDSIWYRDPETGEVKSGGSSMEFIGRDLATI
jgi:hypothetical protein